MEELVCSDCGIVWERPSARGAKPRRCKQCAILARRSSKAATQRKYYRKNRDTIAKKNREYYEANREQMIEKQREYYQENKERYSSQSRNRRYGLSAEEYEEKAKSQGGRCAVCEEQPDLLYVDHDHESGTVRGLLCNHCNLALGHMRDDRVRMFKAIEYLDRYTAIT